MLSAQLADDFGFWGTVKETNVDDEGLMEFYSKYYTFPLYKDTDMSVYKAMGNKKLGLSSLPLWNPFRLYRGFKEVAKRMKEKNISGNLAGEGLVKGGVLFFDTQGELVYAYEEETGEELEVDEILAAIKSLTGATSEDDSSSQEL